MIFAGAGQVLDSFAPVASMKLGSALTGGTDQDHRETRIECHRHQGGFAITRDTFDADLFRIHGLVGFEIVEAARSAPSPGPQRAPVVRLTGLALVDQADDAFGQTGAVVGLNAAGVDGGESPAIGDELLGAGGSAFGGGEPAGARRAPRGIPAREMQLGNGAAAEHHHHRHGTLRVGGDHQRHLNIDLYVRVRRIVDMAEKLLSDDTDGRRPVLRRSW